MSGTSYPLDETYVKVGTEWKYLYRAVDSAGQTIEFMLSARRDVYAAKRFFRKLMRAEHRRLPFTTGTDKHDSYPEAFTTSIREQLLPVDCKFVVSTNVHTLRWNCPFLITHAGLLSLDGLSFPIRTGRPATEHRLLD